MPVSSRALVELVLLGPTSNRRQLQNSPILGDVWIAFASKPSAPIDLLITPYKEQPAGPVALEISKRIRNLSLDRERGQEAQVAYLSGLIAARLFFQEVLQVILPMTKWWEDLGSKTKLQPTSITIESILKRAQLADEDNRTKFPETFFKAIKAIIQWVQAEDEDIRAEQAEALSGSRPLERYFALAGIILWAAKQKREAKSLGGGVVGLIAELKEPDVILEELDHLFEKIRSEELKRLSEETQKSVQSEAQIWQVSLNRKVLPALERSVPAVKGDAARSLFDVKCDKIMWAVIDSGIDSTHEAFKDMKGENRIVSAFDFSNIRKIVSLDHLDPSTEEFKQRVEELRKCPEKELSKKEATAILKILAEDAKNDRPVHWEEVEKFVKIDKNTPPNSSHGTHVAGIIGASVEAKQDHHQSDWVNGMCPDIKLYDFRVLSRTVEDTEFAIIAALQYIRYLNERHNSMKIHGVNLSLSIPHDVRNYACGRTPICNECERLVESGVVVVAAAGNLGYQRFDTVDGFYEGYTAFSITDPGNADGVITVGATHRYRPHTYGVSFFSSRGPTGDGRWKPDLVAPGERVISTLPDQSWGESDGTSMAAPHVSGAAAMLMARYTELIGEPQRIKRILCESATDLGRERSFQGYGMLDVLRAFQNI